MKLTVALFTLAPVFITGALLLFSAHTRRGLLFGVSVPLDFAKSPRGRRMLSVYRVLVITLTLIGAALAVLGTLWRSPSMVTAGPLLLVFGTIVTWVALRHAILPMAVPVTLERHAELSSSPQASNAWLALTIASALPLLASWLYVRAHWAEVPERFPVHWDLAGQVNGWAHRSQAALALPVWIGACVLLLLLGISVFQRNVATINRPGVQRILLPSMAALAWSFAVLFSLLTLLPLYAASGLRIVLTVTALQMVLVFAIVAWLIYRLTRAQKGESYDGTPDSAWRAGGLFYYNPGDAAVLVPKRFGWGWTLNMARPASWIFFTFVLLITVCVILLPHLLR